MRVREQFKMWQGEVVLGLLLIIRVTSKVPGLRSIYRALVSRMINKTKLFDSENYLEANTDVAQKRISPLRHYVSHGDREGRSPMVLFDSVYYRLHAGDRAKGVNALLHYVYVGRYRSISPSPWFDVKFYLANNKDVARAGIDPLVHYLRWGGIEGRSPSPQFDSAYYLHANPEVMEARINPLVHYLLYGRLEGRQALPRHDYEVNSFSGESDISRPMALDDKAWDVLEPRASVSNARLDVVVPVYKGYIETLRCLHSVLAAACEIPFELIVINDKSPDEKLLEALKPLTEKKLFTLLSNSENRGFVHTANRGMKLHAERDVLLLNSDTEVYKGWLDRLYRAAYRNNRTGTVTPLSNNATICSYPCFLHDNPFPLELDYSELDAITSKVNSGVEVEVPSGVGFCMYIKRSCLDDVGLFDEKSFGKGYGEENDFCQRAIRKGWRNTIAADVFVRHWGATSFRGEKSKRIQAALKVIDKRFPHYLDEVAEFIKRDPLLDARRRLDWARMQRLKRKRNVLIVCHNRGGGTERHVQEDAQRLSREGYGIYLLRPLDGKPQRAALSHYTTKSLPNMRPFIMAEITALINALEMLNITEVHTHSLVDFEPESPKHLRAVIETLDARWEVNLHDYKVICPRINLVELNGRYCGEPSEKECNKCLVERGSDFAVNDIHAWRTMHENILRVAQKVFVPDSDVADRLSGYFNEVNFEITPHETFDPKKIKIRLAKLRPNDRLRVVVIGAISKIKGFDVLLACARDAKMNNLPLDYVVLGYSYNDRLLEQVGVIITGRYLEQDALNMLHDLGPHAVWLPSTWPETYSYTLSLAFKAGYPVFAFRLGAISRRLSAAGQNDTIFPLSDIDNPININKVFMNYREKHTISETKLEANK